MSFNDLSVSIVAQNLASAEFARVAADAGAMATQVSGQTLTLNVQDFASSTINTVAEDATRLKAQVEGNPISISFAPIEVPEIPPIDMSPIEAAKVSFNETGLSAAQMGDDVKLSAGGFAQLSSEAAATTVSLRTVASGFSAVGHMGIAVSSLAGDFGLVDKESAKWVRTFMSVITLMGAFVRVQALLTTITTGHTASIALNTTAETSNASASIATSIAHKIKAAATWLAVAAQNALNISHATFLALTGVGIGVVIAAAAAMAYFASQMNSATQGIQNFNSAAAETPTRSRSVQRAGEESMYRRGVE